MDMKTLLLSADPVGALRKLDREGTLAELEPTLAELRMPIPKGFHHKDNLEHSIRVLERAIEREGAEPDLILRTAALFHDVGKPATRKFRKPATVTFREHEAVGATMARKLLVAHGYSKAERQAIDALIRHHMRSHGFAEDVWTDSAVRRLATDAGSERQLDRLLVLFTSDLTTRHEGKRRRIEAGIEALRQAIERVRAADAKAARRPAINGHELMELTGLKGGRELGQLMKALQTEEAIVLDRSDALALLARKFPEHFNK